MKTQVSSFLLLALATLLVKAQTSSELSYEDTILGLFAKEDIEGLTFRPLLEDLQVETLSPENVDESGLTMKRLSFTAQETMCDGPQEQQEEECPLNENGQTLVCNLVVSHPVQDISQMMTSDMACEKLEPEDAFEPKIRSRRGLRRWLKKRERRLRHWVKRNKDKIKTGIAIIQGISSISG